MKVRRTKLKSLICEEETTSQGYKFDDFKWLANRIGFGVPTDVKYGTIYLGTIEAAPAGYQIVLVDTPKGKIHVMRNDELNLFKNKNQAAEKLHKLWKMIRKHGDFSA